MPTILIVEDEQQTADTITLFLEKQGYHCITAYDGQKGISYLLRHPVDLIVLDWMLPGLSGIEICQLAKSIQDVKILMLSARASISDKVTGLDLGADDYLSKPFSLHELNARIRMLLRETYTVDTKEEEHELHSIRIRLKDGELLLNKSNHLAMFNKNELTLTMIEFNILCLLGERGGKVITIEDIAAEIYGANYRGDPHTITVHLSNLRTKLKQVSSSQVIKTIYGIGYKLDDIGIQNHKATQ